MCRRHQIIREVTQKIAEIQNAGLGEHRIRDLNDEINKLLREKNRWEERIKGVWYSDVYSWKEMMDASVLKTLLGVVLRLIVFVDVEYITCTSF